MPDIHLGDELWAFFSGFYIDKNNDAGIGIPARQMAKFDMYTESPVDAAERANRLELHFAVANQIDNFQ
jgi:hypothetical protein